MPVRFGICGAGAMARAYAQALATEVPDGILVAVGGGSRAPDVARDYGVDAEPTADALIARDDIDAVIVATPPSSHMPLTLAAAAAGRHVLTEKPMARTVSECDAMIAACHDAGVLLAVNKLTRYRDTGRTAREAIVRGDIGDVLMIRVQLTQAGYEDHTPAAVDGIPAWIRDPAEGSTFLDWGCHAADMIRWLSGSDARLAFGQFADFAAVPEPPLLRSGMVQYTLESGALAQVWCTTEMAPPGMSTETEYVVMGSKGTLVADLYGKLSLGRGDQWVVLCEQSPIDYMNNPWDPHRIRGWALQTQEFATCILDGGRPGVTGEDGRAAIEMVEAAERSNANGESVRLPVAD